MNDSVTPRFQRILVTNDDGIGAPGLAVAEAIAAELADEVWVVAPEHDQSGVGQSISLHTPLRAYEQGVRRYALSGTPADCVMFALADWLAETPPDLVLSGVNCGANLSDSVMYSGTVGAVLAAAHLAVPAVALSQTFDKRSAVDYAPARRFSAALVRDLWRRHPQHGCWNINFPALPAASIVGSRMTRQVGGSVRRSRLKPGTDGRGLAYNWLTFEHGTVANDEPQSDVAALDDGRISVMPLRLSRCDDDLARQWDGNCDLPLPEL